KFYLEADLKSEDLTKFNIEKETIELVKIKRQERKETLYAKTCTGWVFGHKKGSYEWFKCLDDEEQKELFGETEVVKNIKTKPSKTETVIKTTSSDNEPPVLDVVEALTVTDPRYTIEGKVSDKGSDKIYLKVDGQDVLINKGKFVINRYSPVDETIKITAIDKWGNEVTKMIKVIVNMESSSVAEVLEPLNASKIRTKSSNNKVALIIGIEQYEQSPKASYANLDAKYFYDYARKAFGVKKQNIKMLIDQDASLSKTNSAIFKWLPGKIKANETDLIIFFSGHGLASNDGKEKYILPSNADPDLLTRTALSRSELFDEIVKLNPKSVTMFFDTCYSGVSRDEKTLLASAKPLRIVADDDKEVPDNFTIFTASKGDQISSGLKEAKHGIFSYYLMKGLEGKADANKDKDISNGELLAYMNKNVSNKALDLGRQQNPMLSGDPDKILMSYR
ncbi:caspase family protein, partial [Candidatus Pelagibacter sp.]|nr:caspase family protein [Candidatus Pelagibacter sp.]